MRNPSSLVRLRWAVGAAIAVSTPLSAMAVGVTASTAEFVTFRDCIAAQTSCDAISDIVQGSYGGSPGAASSSASMSSPEYGSVSGSVSLSGVIGAPILRTSAYAGAGKRVSTNSYALQSFTYTGSAVTSRTFSAAVTYIKTPSPADTVEEMGASAGITAFTLPGATVDVGSTAEDNFNALDWLSAQVFDGMSVLASDNRNDFSRDPQSALSLGITVTLNPGMRVWVLARLQTPAVDGGFVDATHTMVTSWDNPASLVPAVTAVPEPATYALWLVGLTGVVGVGARRRASRG